MKGYVTIYYNYAKMPRLIGMLLGEIYEKIPTKWEVRLMTDRPAASEYSLLKGTGSNKVG